MCRPNWLVALFVILAFPAFGQEAKPKEQIWEGKIELPGAQLALVLRIAGAADGGLKAVVDSPDQGVKGIPCSSVSLDETTLKFAIADPKIQAQYEGKLSADKQTSVGTFTQRGQSFKLTLRKVAKASAGIEVRPQTPKPPFPYASVEVRYPNKPAGITLAGTLTKPKTGGPFPAVILITGSGPQDRDETILGHKPFAVIADSLTRRGIAVLRVDDRGIGKSTGNFHTATTKDFASDVKAGLRFLRSRNDIDPKRIGLMGHSEGGIIAPMVAADDRKVAFVVMMAGTGVPGRDIIARQSHLISKAAGAPAIQLKLNDRASVEVFDVLQREPNDKKAVDKIVAVLERLQGEAPKDPNDKSAKEMRVLFEAHAKTLVNPWMRFFAFYDPRPALRKLRVPVLVTCGSRDLQVDPAQNIPEIKKALRKDTEVQIAVLPGLNHLFQKCKTGAPTEYRDIQETVDPVALKTFGDWIVWVTSRHSTAKARR